MYLLIISLLLIAYYVVMIMRNPDNWLSYLHLLPIITFMMYARLYGMQEQAWAGAFEVAGIVAAIIIALLWHQGIVMDRIMLGLNIFLIIGACGFLFDNAVILDWYSTSKGGPLFSCIAAVGFFSMFCTKTGFIGVPARKKEIRHYTSFLLLAATFIALVWSVSAEVHGLFWAVVLPFIVLRITRDQLITHLL